MRIYLSALGWITDAPAGNRLRWVYPYDAIIDGAFAGLPEVLVVERAPLSKDRLWQLEQFPLHLSSLTPFAWWEARGDVALGIFPDTFPLGGVQGVRFTYRGPTARILAIDADRTSTYAFDQVVSDGQVVIVEGSNLDELRVLAFGGAGLEDLRTLDLFADHPELDWRAIAEIRVADTANAAWADVEPRRDGPGTMDDPRWTDLRGPRAGGAGTTAGSRTSGPVQRLASVRNGARDPLGTRPPVWLGMVRRAPIGGVFAGSDGPRGSTADPADDTDGVSDRRTGRPARVHHQQHRHRVGRSGFCARDTAAANV